MMTSIRRSVYQNAWHRFVVGKWHFAQSFLLGMVGGVAENHFRVCYLLCGDEPI